MVDTYKRALAFFLIAAVAVPYTLLAQSSGRDVVDDRREELERTLEQIEDEIAEQQGVLDVQRQQSASLARDVSILDASITKARLSIEHRDLTIQSLTGDIGTKANTIDSLTRKMEREKQSLAQLIRKTNEIDNVSLVEIILGNEDLSEFLQDLDEFEAIKDDLNQSFRDIEDTKAVTAVEKEALETKRTAEVELQNLQILEKQKIEREEAEKAQLLEVSRGIEAGYQAIIDEKQRTAAQIRSELFALRDTAAIPFGDAYEFALAASKETGVRPALILAILKQETNLGENIGQCLLTNTPNKGDGKGANTGRFFAQVMKGSRDVDPFLQITRELGLDPFSQVVSCPPGYGFGGAMGPSQFIPSTWMLYKDRLGQTTGENPPNPWNPRTAIFATALLMDDNGASQGTRYAERLAALRYFAGWVNAENPSYAFYGDEVMRFADQFQADINVLAGS